MSRVSGVESMLTRQAEKKKSSREVPENSLKIEDITTKTSHHQSITTNSLLDEGMALNRSQGKQSKAPKIAKKLLKSKNINQLEQKLEPNGSFLLYSHISNHINNFTRFFSYTQVFLNKT